jgi:hypothetical protein
MTLRCPLPYCRAPWSVPGVRKGKDAVREYWRPSLSLDPPLQCELVDVLVGVAQITLYYRNVGRRVVAETRFIDDSGKVTHGIAQWSVTKS